MKKWIMAMPTFLAAGVAASPVLTCPLCWPLYAGLLSALGLGFVDYTPYLFPVTAVLLLVSLIPLGWKAPHRRGYRPLVGGIIASFLILGGKFYFNAAWIFYTGIALLLAASIRNLWPKEKVCTACAKSEKTELTAR